jgi:NAD(P)-dependent dehydrogenase (short-subunit alcohol dehydrogenase family)
VILPRHHLKRSICKVHCLDRLPKPDAEFSAASERHASRYGGSISYAQVDVRDASDLDNVISEIADSYGHLDGLIAAAGVQKVTPALDYPPDEISEMLAINYTGVYLSAVSCARQMIKYSVPGSMLLVASMSGFIANKGLTSSVYNSSKAAVIQLARSLAMEWGQIIDGKPIRVNALCPGNIMTPMVKKNFEDDPGLREIWERENMMGRISDPEEYRGAALFALSNASSFMTGSKLVIDGGYSAW